ncbi:unnamed protein product [Calypogeia fissa]
MDPDQIASTVDEMGEHELAMVVTKMGMEKTLIPGLVVLVKNLELMCETVPVQRAQCAMLADLVAGLTPLLEEIQKLRHPLSDTTINTFRELMHALIGAQIVLKKMKECSKIKLLFRNTTLTGQLSEATLNVRACISSFPLVQLGLSEEMQQEVKILNLKLGELGNELKGSNSMRKDQQDLAAEVADVLRDHNIAEASSSTGGAKVMDKLIAWLAQHFHSDVDTVRRDWEVMREEALYPREKLESTSQNKRQLEEELLQTMIFIETEERQCPTCVMRGTDEYFPSNVTTELDFPKEFICPICLQTLVEPVITSTGFTYCKKCITNWFKEYDTCPNTREKTTKTMIDNMTLRSLISRWGEMYQSAGVFTSALLDISSNRPSLEELIIEPVAPIEQVISDRNFSPQSPSTSWALIPRSPSSSTSTTPVKSVTTYISLLSSKWTMQILKSLKELTSLASYPKGQVEVFEAGGIPAITQLLKEKDTSIAEKAAGVLEALTFEIKGKSTLSYEQRDQICSAVTDIALDELIDFMLYGSSTGRLKAAKTVINILGDEEIRAEVGLRSGVVSAFFSLINVGEGLIFPDEGKSLCIKGLNLLSGEKVSGAIEGAALTIALLRLAATGLSPQVVEESLGALRSLIETEGEKVCKILHENKAIPFLVRLVSRLPSGRGREEALKILNEICILDGMPDVIVQYELFAHLLPVLNEANQDGDCVKEATRLLNTCLSSVRGDVSSVLSQADLKGLVGLLGLGRTSVDSKVDILSSLEYLCRSKTSFSLRVAFLNSAGVATLQVLVKSYETADIKDGVARLMRILSSFSSCRKDICNQGGMQLLICLLADDSLTCHTQAVVGAESLMSAPESSSIMSLDGFPVEKVLALLAPTYELECRGAAVGILSVLASRNCVLERYWDRRTVELLLDMVRPDSDLPTPMRKKAAEALLAIVMQYNSVCPYVVEEDGLSVLIAFGLMLGNETRVMVIQLLSIFSKADVNCKQAVLEADGAKILLEGLERGKMKEECAFTLGHLVEGGPARKAVLQAGFIPIAVKCIQANVGNKCSLELTRALVTVTDCKDNAVSIRESEGVQALLSVLEGSAEPGKKLAAIALTKLLKFDQESSIPLRHAGGISPLYKFLVYQEAEGSPPFDDVEALDTLSVASEEQTNKVLIINERPIPLLVSISTRGAPRTQELALSILLNLSREGPSPGEHDLCGTLIKERICKHLFDIVQPQSQLYVTETAVYSAICIIRNLSLSGVPARTAMLEEGDGAIKVLLDRIRFHDANASTEAVRGAVIALERFMLNSRGKMALIREGGIQVIVQVLHYRLGSGQAKSFATKILVMMAQDSQASKEVCIAIFEANVIPGLRDILELGPSPECKLQACTLLKFLMYSGPRTAVCKRIREENCIPKLLDLRSDVTCHEAATGAIDLLKTYDKESRRLINEADQHPTWSRSSSLSS